MDPIDTLLHAVIIIIIIIIIIINIIKRIFFKCRAVKKSSRAVAWSFLYIAYLYCYKSEKLLSCN